MGKVYEATDVALDRRVAVKVIREDWVHNAGAAKRFAREARAVAGFTHPNVVTVHDYGLEGDRHAFLVMELLVGSTLREELRRRGRLDPSSMVAMFQGLCDAVEVAHRRRLVHRDLKPENIFLARTTKRDTAVKILDFGVAKPVSADDKASGLEDTAETDVGVLVGTIGYISPEQLLGERPDVSWDLWALAVVAYESLTGALPFSLHARGAWRQLVLSGHRTPMREHLADPPPRWEAFFDSALATDRSKRPHSAAEFFQRLSQALG